MNKRNLIIASVIFILALGVGGFYLWLQKKADLTQTNTEKQEEQAVKQGEGQGQKNNKKVINTEKEIIIDRYISMKKQEELREKKDLVWYEIPELKIRFLVTKDAKKDLKYDLRNVHNVGKFAYLYSQSEVKFAGCVKDEEGITECSKGILGRFANSLNEAYKKRYREDDTDTEAGLMMCNNIIARIDRDIICFTGPQATAFGSPEEYREYLKLTQDKKFRVYLATLNSIK